MFLCFFMLWDGVRIADDTLDNDDTLNTTQSDSESTDRGETTTNSTSDHVQNTEHSTLRNTQTEESSAMSTSTSEGKHLVVQVVIHWVTPRYFNILSFTDPFFQHPRKTLLKEKNVAEIGVFQINASDFVHQYLQKKFWEIALLIFVTRFLIQ